MHGGRAREDHPRPPHVFRGHRRGFARGARRRHPHVSMPTPIVMPQMGESIAEGTIVRWIKKVGDQVDRDEPLFEITTDKVDAEIPSPAAGILTEITAKEGDTVSVNSVVGTIQVAGEEPPRRLAEASGEGGPASTTESA